jgi:hypothetical protein
LRDGHALPPAGKGNQYPMSRPTADASASIPRQLGSRVAIALVAKLALLAVLYLLFFSPSHRPHIDAAAIVQRFLPSR